MLSSVTHNVRFGDCPVKEHIVRLKAEICQRPSVVQAYREELAKLVADKPSNFEDLVASFPYKRLELRKKGRVLCLAYAFARGKEYAVVESNPSPLDSWSFKTLVREVAKALEGTVSEEAVLAWMAPAETVEVAA